MVQHRDRFVLCIVRDFMVSLLIKIYRTIILPVVLNGCETWSLTVMPMENICSCEGRIGNAWKGHTHTRIT